MNVSARHHISCRDVRAAAHEPSSSAPTPPTITSPSAPDLAEVRAWIEKMIKALRFVELVIAIVALIGRMRDINLELMKQLVQSSPGTPALRDAASDSRPARPSLHDRAAAASRPSAKPKPKKSRKGRHPGRAALPAHLPRVEVINAVPPEQRICPLCGRMMTTVGHELCEILEVHPARVFVIARKDETVACPNDDTIVSATPPPQIVERGKLGDTLIVEAVADKYLEHQPIERQCRASRASGVEIAPQTLGRSVAADIDLLAPIARLIAAETPRARCSAPTPRGIPVLDQDHPHGIRTGTMWCWVGDQTWVTFFYSRNGDSESVRDFLGDDLCRTVQCDGTSITELPRARRRQAPRLLGPRAPSLRRLRARRRSARARGAAQSSAALFAVERLSTRAGDTPEQRLARRNEHSAPALDELRAWIDEQARRHPAEDAARPGARVPPSTVEAPRPLPDGRATSS